MDAEPAGSALRTERRMLSSRLSSTEVAWIIARTGENGDIVTPERFSQYVNEALEDIPPELREKMDNVEIFVEEIADPETLDSLAIESSLELLGLYAGVPLTQRSFFQTVALPDRIYLYRIPIMKAAGTRDGIVDKIREVVIHEVGHHFGFSDAELSRMKGRSG